MSPGALFWLGFIVTYMIWGIILLLYALLKKEGEKK
jgi:hypothetical protein